MTTAVELLRQGRRDEFWQRHCGFFPLDSPVQIHRHSRRAASDRSNCTFWPTANWVVGSGGDIPLYRNEFLWSYTPLTTYKDYLPHLVEQRKTNSRAKPVCWRRTSGQNRPIPLQLPPCFSHLPLRTLLKAMVTLLTLAGAKFRGDIRIEEGDTLFCTAASASILDGHWDAGLLSEFLF